MRASCVFLHAHVSVGSCLLQVVVDNLKWATPVTPLFFHVCVCVNRAWLESGQMVIFLAWPRSANSHTLSGNTSCLRGGITKPNTHQKLNLS